MRKYLIIKTSSMGDVLHAREAYFHLRALEPEAQIDWVIEKPFQSLLEDLPQLNNVLVIDTKKWRRSPFSRKNREERRAFQEKLQKHHYDIAFDLQGNLKSGWALSKARAKEKVGFGYVSAPEKLNLFFTTRRFNPPKGRNVRDDLSALIFLGLDKEERALSSLSKPPIQEPLKILVCPFSRWKNKELPLDQLAQLLTRLKEAFTVEYLFPFSGEKEKEKASKLAQLFPKEGTLLEPLTLSQLKEQMKEVDLVFAMDSLPLHLSALVETATVSFFGASLPEKYAPRGDHHLALFGTCPYGKTFEKRCPILRTCKTGACMGRIDHAFEKIKAHIKGLMSR